MSVLSPVLLIAVHFYFLSLNKFSPFHDARIYNKELLRLLKLIPINWICLLPLALGLYYGLLLLSKRSIKLLYIKAYLSVIGIILANLLDLIILFYVLRNPDTTARTITIISIAHSMICYTLSVVGSIWFYRLTPTVNAVLKQPRPHKINQASLLMPDLTDHKNN